MNSKRRSWPHGSLRIEVNADLFLTAYLGDVRHKAMIQLRNPTTHQVSDRIPFHVQSFIEHTIEIPQDLEGPGGTKLKLFNDLVSDGQLEIILSLDHKSAYLGVGPKDVSIIGSAYEYVHISGTQTIITQSAETLKRMLGTEAKPVRTVQTHFTS